MPPRRTTDLRILIAALVATLLLSGASFVISPVDSSPAIDGSSLAVHAGGSKAAYLALKAAGYDVRQSYEPAATMRLAPRESVLVIASPIVAPSRLDTRALAQFLEAGGTVLATGRVAIEFLPGLTLRGAPADSEATVVTAAMPSRFSAGVPEIVMTPASSELAADSRYVVIYGTTARPAVVAARVGRGMAIWWAGYTPLSNAGISAPGHVELLLNVLGPPGERVVFWDEHYHGYSRSFLSYIAGTPTPYAGAQLALVLVVALLAFSRRTWPVRAQHVEPRTSPLEFVDSMGSLYQRANASAGAVATVRARVRRMLSGACGLPASVPDEQLSRACAARIGVDSAALHSALATSAAAAGTPDVSAAAARSVIADLQGIAASVKSQRSRTVPRRHE